MAVTYPVDIQMEMLLASFVDEETGEITATDEEMQEAVEKLQLDFDNTIIQLRNSFKNDSLKASIVEAEAKVLRDEAAQTQKRANAIKNKAERTKRFIAYLLNGEKFDKDGVKITYRKSETCVVEDGFNEWAITHAPELLKIEAKTSEIKNALNSGISVDFAHIETRNNIQIK